ncbi:MAG: hypothetical protein CME64_16555 [Halobacteriovoraceae bacterium]|nr:hypothetical protein [Halobacteriovoraceae bacterium]
MDGNDQTFNLSPITDEEFEASGLSKSDLWMLQFDEGDVFGPFSTEMLREHSAKNEELYDGCKAFNVVSEKWKSFYTISEFQRRRPKLVPAQGLINSESFLVLTNGQKNGPYTLDELKQKVAQKEIVLNQEVSVDDGKTWIKLYEHHAFDRRLRQNQEELPFQPEPELFSKTEEEMYSKVVSLAQKKEDSTAISGLAYIGRGNDKGQTMAKDKPQEQESLATVAQFPQVKAKKSFSWKKFSMAMGLVLVVSAAFNTFNSSSIDDSHQLGETFEGDTKRINNTDRGTRVRKPASVNKNKRKRPARVQRAKKYEDRSPRNDRVKRNRPERFREEERISHTYEDFENLDIEDPMVREELTRELAGEILNRNEDNPPMDDNGEYTDSPDYPDYPEEQDYPEELPPEQESREAEYQDEPAYEEYSDFE